MKAPFLLSQADSRPMYQQIVENIHQLIMSGTWKPSEALPSIRELAVSLKVSVITVKRAYQELETNELIITRHGKGSFVAEQMDSASALTKKELQGHLKSAVSLAELLHLDKKDVIQELDNIYQQNQKDAIE